MPYRTICNACNHVLQESESPPCPVCGGVCTTYVTIEDHLRVTESTKVIGHKRPSSGVEMPGDRTEAVRISIDHDQSIVAEQAENGTLSYAINVKRREGEAGTVEVCNTLVARLNEDGDSWSAPVTAGGREEGVDCVAFDGGMTLKMQVTRAESDSRLWSAIHRHGRVTDRDTGAHSTSEDAADALCKTIEKKAARTAPAQRTEIVLVLDATETVGQAFRQVVDCFRDRHGLWAHQLGFRGIWLVGPTTQLTTRLDAPEPTNQHAE